MGLSPNENKVYFGQLLGMCDQISFPLGMLTLIAAAIMDACITSCASPHMRQICNTEAATGLSHGLCNLKIPQE